MNKHKGVTLIELLIVITIIGILASLAFPTYQDHLFKIRRTDGQQKLLQIATELETLYELSHSYLNTNFNLANLGIESEYYDFKLAAVSEHAYTLVATPILEQAQEKDPCGELSITHEQVMGPRKECWG